MTETYQERRVRVSDYSSLLADDPRLVRVDGNGARALRLHHLAAEKFLDLRAAAQAAGFSARVASSWRPHRWASRASYEAHIVKRYGSVARGRKWLAFDSPHETGLAVDFGSDGLSPRSATAEKQRATPFHAWLVEHAWSYGWHPYKREPWHWECPVDRAAFETLPETET